MGMFIVRYLSDCYQLFFILFPDCFHLLTKNFFLNFMRICGEAELYYSCDVWDLLLLFFTVYYMLLAFTDILLSASFIIFFR